MCVILGSLWLYPVKSVRYTAWTLFPTISGVMTTDWFGVGRGLYPHRVQTFACMNMSDRFGIGVF